MVPPPADPAAIWLDAPCAALQLWRDADGPHWRLNPAGIGWSLARGLADADWQQLASAQLQAGIAPGEGAARVAALPLHWRAVALSSGWLLWLLPQADDDAQLRAAADKLALLQSFGRVGFIERDLRSGLGCWDATVHDIFGMQPTLHSPPLDQAMQQVHPDDRERLMQHHQSTVQQAGRYEVHYRIRRPDGRQRDLQSLTEVRNGADGRPEMMLGVLIDDTASADRVRAQQSVSDKLAEALELAMVSVWRIDLQTQRIHYNDIGWRITGLPVQPEGMDLE